MKLVSIEDFEVFCNIPNVLYAVTDGVDRLEKINENWKKSLGYEVEELKEISLFSLIHPDDVIPTVKSMLEVKNDRVVTNFVSRCRHRNGHYINICWNVLISQKRLYATGLIHHPGDLPSIETAKPTTCQLSAIEERLTEMELKLFKFFFRHKGKVIRKNELIELLYKDHQVHDMTINVHISNIRKKLSETTYTIESLGRGKWKLKQDI